MTLISLVGINFLFGLTWLFVIFTFSVNNNTVAFVLQFLFAFFNALQGFFIFFFFVVLNADARTFWQKLLCPCKKKAKPITSTSNKHLVKSSEGENVETLSSALSSYPTSNLEHNVEKSHKQAQEMLTFKNPSAMEEGEEESSPDLMSPPLEYVPAKTPPEEQPENIKEGEKTQTIIIGRVRWQTSIKGTHDIEKVELDFGQSSEESLNEEDF